MHKYRSGEDKYGNAVATQKEVRATVRLFFIFTMCYIGLKVELGKK